MMQINILILCPDKQLLFLQNSKKTGMRKSQFKSLIEMPKRDLISFTACTGNALEIKCIRNKNLQNLS